MAQAKLVASVKGAVARASYDAELPPYDWSSPMHPGYERHVLDEVRRHLGETARSREVGAEGLGTVGITVEVEPVWHAVQSAAPDDRTLSVTGLPVLLRVDATVSRVVEADGLVGFDEAKALAERLQEALPGLVGLPLEEAGETDWGWSLLS